MATTPAAPTRICVGCLLSVSLCSCTTLNPPAVGSENVPTCRCGRLTTAPHLRSLAELGKAVLRQAVTEGDPLALALVGTPDPVIVEPAADPCRCGRGLNSFTEPACIGCLRLPEACTCAPLEAQPRRVCLDCNFNDGRLLSVVAHVRATNHRIDLALVESTRETEDTPAAAAAARGTFRARLEEAHRLAQQAAAALAGLAVDPQAFQHGQLFAQVLDDALSRANRQRDFLRSLVAVVANPGARLVLENGRPVVHLPEPSTVDELGAVEITDAGPSTSTPPVPDEENLEATQIRPAPSVPDSEGCSAPDPRQLGLFSPGEPDTQGVPS